MHSVGILDALCTWRPFLKESVLAGADPSRRTTRAGSSVVLPTAAVPFDKLRRTTPTFLSVERWHSGSIPYYHTPGTATR